MLIEEARDITGLSHEKLDEKLVLRDARNNEIGLTAGTCARYARAPSNPRVRAPQAGAIQSLEHRVANLLGRPAHRIVIGSISPLIRGDLRAHCPIDLITGEPTAGINLRDSNAEELWLGYEYGWPTYADLGKFNRAHLHDQSLRVNQLAWQWGCLWKQGLLSREVFGVPVDADIEMHVMTRVAAEKFERHMGDLVRFANIWPRLSLYLQRDSANDFDARQQQRWLLVWQKKIQDVRNNKVLTPDRWLEHMATLPDDFKVICDAPSGTLPSLPAIAPRSALPIGPRRHTVLLGITRRQNLLEVEDALQ
ncbi:hypothetical protein AC233_00310 [Burkholderia sp. HB1]|nr:hypothetical protein AC233_00310 [Burkholderia sp. HB1]